MTVVVDASVLVAALVDSGPEGRWAETVVGENDLVAPESLQWEVTSMLHGLECSGEISGIESNGARRDLRRRDVDLFSLEPFADRVWELRHSMAVRDAWYVAVAEAFECPLATLDIGLSRVSEAECRFLMPTAEDPLGQDTRSGRFDRPGTPTDRGRTSVVADVEGTVEKRILDEIIRRVVSIAQPERIILFGSAARGEMGPHSDIDLLIVKAGADALDVMGDIYLGLRGVGAAVDALVVTPDDVQRYKDSYGMVIREAVREGTLVYDVA